MPNKTFNNLSAEKQEAIIEVALKEFITHDYESASLNQIINDIGIAKGSFYRYFDSKRDLYQYLVDYCLDKKYEYVGKFTPVSSVNFFDEFKNLIHYYLKFNVEHALYAVFLLNAQRNNDITVEQFIFLRNGKQGLMQALKKFQDGGQLSKDYDIEFMFFCVSQILLKMGSYIKGLYGLNEDEFISPDSIDESKIFSTLDQLIAFFRNGFGAK